MKKIILILSISFILCGCYNYNELDNVSICTAMAFDLEDGLYKVSYLIANAKKNQSSSEKGEAQAVIYSGIAPSISEAVDDLITTIPHEPYIAHLKTIIISEELARNGVQNVLDFLLRYPESRNKFDLYITDNEKAIDTLKILSPIEFFPSNSIINNAKTSSIYQSKAIIVEYNDFVATILEEGINPVLTSIKILGDIDEGSKTDSLDKTYLSATLKVSNIGIFKDDKLIKISNSDETIGINFIKNQINELIIPIPCEDNYIVLKTDNSNTKLNLKYLDNKFSINLNVKLDAMINEVNCKVDLQDNQNINKIKDEAQNIIKSYIESAIKLAKENKTDIFGFGTMIYKNYPKKWQILKANWNDNLKDLDINYDVSLKIKSAGGLRQSLEELK